MRTPLQPYVISMIYNDAEIIEESLEQLFKTSTTNPFLVQLDQHWPLNRDKVLGAMNRVKYRHGGVILDPGKNLGLHDGFNWAMKQLPDLTPNEPIIGYDPDCYPVTPGWDTAMCKVMAGDPSVAWVSLWHHVAEREMKTRGGAHVEINGVHGQVLNHACVNSICAWRVGWLWSCGGLREPSKFYGGVECAMFGDLAKYQKKWVALKDFKETNYFESKVNPDYRRWKILHAHSGTVTADFGTWVAAGKPPILKA